MSAHTSAGSRQIPRTRWATFAMIWLTLAGGFNIVQGAAAVHHGEFFGNDFLWWNIDAWGWMILVIGILQVASAIAILPGRMGGYGIGITVAMFGAFLWFFFLFSAPIGALMGLIMNSLVIYALTIGSPIGDAA